jgi:4'-phosphopantetheinyl transferase
MNPPEISPAFRPAARWLAPKDWLQSLAQAGRNQVFAAVTDIHTGVSPGQVATLAAMLDDEDRARAARFRFEADRTRFVIAHGALRLIASNAVGLDHTAIMFAGPPRSGLPPRLVGAREPTVNLSLSHAGPYVAIAVGIGCVVGIDVEAKRDVNDLDALAARALTRAESADLAAVQPDARSAVFLRWWTAKEAALKAQGCGLATPPDEVALRYDESLLPHLALVPDRASDFHPFALSGFDPFGPLEAVVTIATQDRFAPCLSATTMKDLTGWMNQHRLSGTR